MSYQLNKLHLLICILAAFTITAGFIIHNLLGNPFGLFTMVLWVCSVIVVFYFIGHMARGYLINSVFVQKEEELIEVESEIENEFTELETPEEIAENTMEFSDDFTNYEDETFELEEDLETIALGEVS